MKKIFNIQNRIVAKADKTMDEATVMIELSVHMWIVAFESVDESRLSSVPTAIPFVRVVTGAIVEGPGYS